MKIAFFEELERAKTVLLAGAGGGFDIFSGLPLYFWLRRAGKTVHLANLSFSDLDRCDGTRITKSLVRIDAGTIGPSNYFPEGHLARWLTDHYGDSPVYAIERVGAKPVIEAYQKLNEVLDPDTLLLVDGGTDSLMRGDEAGLGTPQEDMASLVAANAVEGLARKFLVTIGFGIDAYHGVCHAHFLENVAALIAEDGYLGAWSLTREMEDFRLYEEVCKYVNDRTPGRPSIVNSSIISSVNGWFGDRHSTDRTEGSTLFINPLMALYWAFRLEKVASRNLYLDQIRNTSSYGQLTMAIEKFYASQAKTRPSMNIPG